MLHKCIELRRSSSYPKPMKKLFSILLMIWLPFSLSYAHAMSTQMMLAEQIEAMEASATSDHHCHQHDVKIHSTGHCKHCVACTLAMANATLKTLAGFHALPTVSAKYLAIETHLPSFQLPPTIKPPILN
jgi:hypothetical protein